MRPQKPQNEVVEKNFLMATAKINSQKKSLMKPKSQKIITMNSKKISEN